MRKDRFGRYLPILTAVTALALYPAVSNSRSTTEKAKSALGDSAREAETPASVTPAASRTES